MKSISGAPEVPRSVALAGILLLASTACGAGSTSGTPAHAPCAPGHGPEAHVHPHQVAPPTSTDAEGPQRAVVVPHAGLTPYEHQGNELVGIATRSLGALEHEVWRSRVAVGSRTPLHTHGSEEIFVFLRGRGRARIGDQVFEFVAPATVIAPAGVPHQFFNTGDEATEAIVIVRVGSLITDEAGVPLDLPWRR
jgi:mannose-6-phosphate isomerase-like protein (cupin superfamily)